MPDTARVVVLLFRKYANSFYRELVPKSNVLIHTILRCIHASFITLTKRAIWDRAADLATELLLKIFMRNI